MLSCVSLFICVVTAFAPRSLLFSLVLFPLILVILQAVHGFDNSGRLYDELGHNVQWWTAADESRFDERANCLATFYSVGSRVFHADIFVQLTPTFLFRPSRSQADMYGAT